MGIKISELRSKLNFVDTLAIEAQLMLNEARENLSYAIETAILKDDILNVPVEGDDPDADDAVDPYDSLDNVEGDGEDDDLEEDPDLGEDDDDPSFEHDLLAEESLTATEGVLISTKRGRKKVIENLGLFKKGMDLNLNVLEQNTSVIEKYLNKIISGKCTDEEIEEFMNEALQPHRDNADEKELGKIAMSFVKARRQKLLNRADNKHKEVKSVKEEINELIDNTYIPKLEKIEKRLTVILRELEKAAPNFNKNADNDVYTDQDKMFNTLVRIFYKLATDHDIIIKDYKLIGKFTGHKGKVAQEAFFSLDEFPDNDLSLGEDDDPSFGYEILAEESLTTEEVILKYAAMEAIFNSTKRGRKKVIENLGLFKKGMDVNLKRLEQGTSILEKYLDKILSINCAIDEMDEFLKKGLHAEYDKRDNKELTKATMTYVRARRQQLLNRADIKHEEVNPVKDEINNLIDSNYAPRLEKVENRLAEICYKVEEAAPNFNNNAEDNKYTYQDKMFNALVRELHNLASEHKLVLNRSKTLGKVTGYKGKSAQEAFFGLGKSPVNVPFTGDTVTLNIFGRKCNFTVTNKIASEDEEIQDRVYTLYNDFIRNHKKKISKMGKKVVTYINSFAEEVGKPTVKKIAQVQFNDPYKLYIVENTSTKDITIGLSMEYDYDPEHGFGMIFYEDGTVGFGQGSTSFGNCDKEDFAKESTVAYEGLIGFFDKKQIGTTNVELPEATVAELEKTMGKLCKGTKEFIEKYNGFIEFKDSTSICLNPNNCIKLPDAEKYVVEIMENPKNKSCIYTDNVGNVFEISEDGEVKDLEMNIKKFIKYTLKEKKVKVQPIQAQECITARSYLAMKGFSIPEINGMLTEGAYSTESIISKLKEKHTTLKQFKELKNVAFDAIKDEANKANEECKKVLSKFADIKKLGDHVGKLEEYTEATKGIVGYEFVIIYTADLPMNEAPSDETISKYCNACKEAVQKVLDKASVTVHDDIAGNKVIDIHVNVSSFASNVTEAWVDDDEIDDDEEEFFDIDELTDEELYELECSDDDL